MHFGKHDNQPYDGNNDRPRCIEEFDHGLHLPQKARHKNERRAASTDKDHLQPLDALDGLLPTLTTHRLVLV